jgi:Protein of unknown function (DUF3795)
MQLTKLRAAPVRQVEVPPCAPVGGMDGGTASQLIRSVGRTNQGKGGAAVGQLETRHPRQLRSAVIAPCGINCGVCRLVFRARGACRGCRSRAGKPKYCARCVIRNCSEIRKRGRRFCVECPTYPCPRLRRLDARYRRRYRTSLLENLEQIRQLGAARFLRLEKRRWACPGCGLLTSVHEEACLYCGHART